MNKLFAFIFIGLLLLVSYLFYLIKTQKIKIEYSIIWILSILVVSILSFSVRLLHLISSFLGIMYPPSLLIIVIFFLGVLILLNLTKLITELSTRNKINMQSIAISELDNFQRKSEILIIIPALNEGKNIEKLINDLREKCEYDIVVINDGSRDQTENILNELNCYHIDLPVTSGYGVALETGYKFAYEKDYKYVDQIDGDGQHEPADIEKLVQKVQTTNNDVIVGSRFLANETNYNPTSGRKFGMSVMKLILKVITGRKITDPTSGYQILNKKVIKFFTQKIRFPTKYPDADMLLLLHKNNFNFKEIPVRMYSDRGGESMHNGFINGIKYSIQMILSLLIITLAVNPKQN